VRFIGINIVRLRDGKIVECWAVEDSVSLLRQLGGIPIITDFRCQCAKGKPDQRHIAASICGQSGEVKTGYMTAIEATEHPPDNRSVRLSGRSVTVDPVNTFRFTDTMKQNH